MDKKQMDENRIGEKQDWTKSFGPKPVGRNVGARVSTCRKALFAQMYQRLNKTKQLYCTKTNINFTKKTTYKITYMQTVMYLYTYVIYVLDMYM